MRASVPPACVMATQASHLLCGADGGEASCGAAGAGSGRAGPAGQVCTAPERGPKGQGFPVYRPERMTFSNFANPELDLHMEVS